MTIDGSALNKTFIPHHLKLRNAEKGVGVGRKQELEDIGGKDYEKPPLDSKSRL